MTTNIKITSGPNAFDMAVNHFHPTEGDLLQFILDGGDDIHVSIDCSRCLNSIEQEFELELYMPFPQAYRFKVLYNCHTRKGEILETSEEGPDPELDQQLERAEHAMIHGTNR